MARYKKQYSRGGNLVPDNLIDSLCPTFNNKLLKGLPLEEYQKENHLVAYQDGLPIAAAYPAYDYMIPTMHPAEMSPGEVSDKDKGISMHDMASFVSSQTGNLATTLQETDSIRVGVNNKIYVKNLDGHVFKGNAHVTTSKLSLISKKSDLNLVGQKVGKVAEPAGLALDAIDIGKGIMEDGGQFGCNAQRATAGAAGKKVLSKAGAKSGAKLGAIVGAKIGVFAGGVGAAPGAAIGAVVGGLIGAFAGGRIGSRASKRAYDEVSQIC